METLYNPTLVVLSILVAMLASYVALTLAGSISHAHGRARLLWLAGGALAMGIGIWSMHFVGMLAFEMPGMAMAYDIPLMILSVLIAVGSSAIALFVVSRSKATTRSVIFGGVSMALAIAGMHYTGMYSMRMAAIIQWDYGLVALSVLIALIASYAALLISIRLRHDPILWPKIAASILMGCAISGMHYTGMFAATFIHSSDLSVHESNLLVTSGLASAVIAMTILILGLALVGTFTNRLLERQAAVAAAALRSSEERFRRLINNIEDYAIYSLDPEGRVTSWNSGAENLNGYTAEEILGEHFSVFYPKDQALCDPNQELEASLRNGHFSSECELLRKDGTQFWANVILAPLFDEDGNHTGFSNITRDITERRETDVRLQRLNEDLERRVELRAKELQIRETQLHLITNAVPVLIGQLDRDERFLFANNAFCKWFQREPQQVVGRTFREILGEDRYPHNEPHIKKALRGEIATYERSSSNGEITAILSITFMPEFAEGEARPAGFILLATDVTKYKQIETELKEAKEQAEVANASKSAFLANMSHEIRTPLGVLLGFSELLLNPDISFSEKTKSVEVIRRNGQLLTGIINDILDLSKVEAGKIDIERSDILFDEVVREIHSLLNLAASEKGIKLTLTTEGAVPNYIKTDPLRLRQILLNVVGNAIKFTERGSVTVHIKQVNESTGTRLAFVISDTGRGIPPEHAAKLFQPFTQADASTTRKFGGTGLGLALSKKLAHALGGDLTLSESQPGKGSTFLITIDPGSPERVLQRSLENSKPPVASFENSAQLGQRRVLLVEDSLDNQTLFRHFLRTAGAEVEIANNGREGVDKAISQNFDVVLMDLQMPEMDGFEATRVLRNQRYTKPIIALTAHAMKEERRRCLENGFDEHLTKPISRDVLVRTVAHYSSGDTSNVIFSSRGPRPKEFS